MNPETSAALLPLLACPQCRASLTSTDDGYACAACGQRYRRYGAVPSLVPPNDSVALRYDIDWHPSTVATAVGAAGALKKLKRFFERQPIFERTVGHLLNPVFHNTIKWHLDRTVRGPGTSVLDVGVRRGTFTKHLNARVVGIDIDLPSLESLAASTSIVPFHATAEHMPFQDHTFDVVFCTEVIEHIENDEAVIREIARVVKHDGAAIITTPNGAVVPLIREINHVHLRHYRPDALRVLLERYFQAVEVKTVFGWKSLIELEARVYQAFVKRPTIGRYLFRTFLCALQTVLYHGVERWMTDRGRGYTLLATARRPR